LSRAVIEPLGQTLVAEHGEELAAILTKHGIAPDTGSQAALLLQGARLQARARETLRHMSQTLDYREPDWAKGIPKFIPPAAKGHTFKTIIKEEDKLRRMGRDSVPMREKTIRKYLAICAEFGRFRGKGGSNPATITADELERWKVSLLNGGKVGNRTASYKLGAVKTVVRWARALHKGEFTRSAAEVDEVKLPDFTPKPSDQSAIHPDEAIVILKASRGETEPRLRWLPWLCAYSGLRISEASSLVREDFFDSEGHWFFEVSASGKRSLKTANARRTIPVHRALLKEGFREFVETIPRGRLFKSGADTSVQPWVRSGAVGVTRPEMSPNHGWRHLFEDLCRRYGLTDDARLYLVGHSTGGADQGYGRTRAMLPGLWRQLEKIKPFKLA
jgi:integrase